MYKVIRVYYPMPMDIEVFEIETEDWETARQRAERVFYEAGVYKPPETGLPLEWRWDLVDVVVYEVSKVYSAREIYRAEEEAERERAVARELEREEAIKEIETRELGHLPEMRMLEAEARREQLWEEIYGKPPYYYGRKYRVR